VGETQPKLVYVIALLGWAWGYGVELGCGEGGGGTDPALFFF
jgi:hypothetical protein